MQDLTWIDIKKQRIPKDKKSKSTFLLLDITERRQVHACWVAGTLVYCKGYYPVDMCKTHWCKLPSDVKEWNDVDILICQAMQCPKLLSGSHFLVINDAGWVEHVYVNTDGDLMMLGIQRKYEGTPLGWLNLPEFKD